MNQNYLKQLLEYDPETGEFRWRISRSNCVKVGDIAGGPDDKGYRRISIDNVSYFASRLAWLYMMGGWPPADIDHKNRNPRDDRWENLRSSSRSENCANRRGWSASKRKGAYWHKRDKYWFSVVRYRGKAHHLGRFDTCDAAHEAYLKAAREKFGEFARAQ